MDEGIEYSAFNRLIPPFAALRAFEAFGRLGGVRKAAASLGIDHSAVSRHLKHLEEWVRIELVDRTSGVHHLTAEGSRYYAQVLASFRILADATEELGRGEPTELIMRCSPGFASKWLTRELHRFRQLAPLVHVNLRPTDEPADFVAQSIDGDIRYIRAGRTAAKGLIRDEFIAPPLFPVASPDYLRKLGPLRSVDDLARATLLHESADEWSGWFAAQSTPRILAPSGMMLWHADLTLQAAVHGHGIALSNKLLASEELKSGSLEIVKLEDGSVFPEVHLGGYSFISTKVKWSRPNVQLFRRWLTVSVRQFMAA